MVNKKPTKRLEFPRVEVVEETQEPLLHLLDVGHVGQEGVLDDGCPRTAGDGASFSR